MDRLYISLALSVFYTTTRSSASLMRRCLLYIRPQDSHLYCVINSIIYFYIMPCDAGFLIRKLEYLYLYHCLLSPYIHTRAQHTLSALIQKEEEQNLI